MSGRALYSTESDPGLQAVADEFGVHVTCSDDWCGDTETGFGASVTVNLTKQQALELAKFIIEAP